MAKIYTKNTWVDEVLAGADRYDIKEDGGTAFKEDMRIDLATAVSVAGTPANAEKMNNIEDGLDAVDTLLSDLIDEQRLIAKTGGTVTISGGVITVAPGNGYGHYKVATEGAAAADDVDTITGGVNGDVIALEMATAGQVPTLKNATGNILLSTDLALSVVTTVVFLRRDATNWKLVAPPSAASGPEIVAETTPVTPSGTTETDIFSKSITLDGNDLVDLILFGRAYDGASGFTIRVYKNATLLLTLATNGLPGNSAWKAGEINIRLWGNGASAQRLLGRISFLGTNGQHYTSNPDTVTAAQNWTSADNLRVTAQNGAAGVAFVKYSSVYTKYTV